MLPVSEANDSMSGMPVLQSLVLLASVIVVVVATGSQRVHPFLAIIVIASAFAMATGFSVGFLGKTFGSGFSQLAYAPGLVIGAAGLVAGLAERSGATERLMATIGRRRWSTALAVFVGLIAGAGASRAAAFAVLTPWLRSIGSSPTKRASAMIGPALAISASHGLLFSPVPIAAASIIGAKWDRFALFGLPLTVLLAAIGAAWSRSNLVVAGAAVPASPNEPGSALERRGGWPATVLVLATAVPLLLLMIQSLGDLPSEPLGGGPAREMILGLGRPLILLLAGLGIMAIGLWRLSFKLLADSAWTSRILGEAAGVALIVAAAGGLQRLCQETGMAEMLGERLLGWHVAGYAGLVIPFSVAAVMKTLQGSSLVAAITTAGMVQPILAPLGLGDETGKALAALAIGAGAMTMSHVNDEFFWLVTANAGMSPPRGIAAVTVGTLVQGLAALAALLIIAALHPHF